MTAPVTTRVDEREPGVDEQRRFPWTSEVGVDARGAAPSGVTAPVVSAAPRLAPSSSSTRH